MSGSVYPSPDSLDKVRRPPHLFIYIFKTRYTIAIISGFHEPQSRSEGFFYLTSFSVDFIITNEGSK